MSSIIIIDKDARFAEDVVSYIALMDSMFQWNANSCGPESADVLTDIITDAKEEMKVAGDNVCRIAISASLVNSIDVSRYQNDPELEVVTFAHTEEELKKISKLPYKSYGMCGDMSKTLASRIYEENFEDLQSAESPEAKAPVEKESKKSPVREIPPTENKQEKKSTPEPVTARKEEPEDDEFDPEEYMNDMDSNEPSPLFATRKRSRIEEPSVPRKETVPDEPKERTSRTRRQDEPPVMNKKYRTYEEADMGTDDMDTYYERRRESNTPTPRSAERRQKYDDIADYNEPSNDSRNSTFGFSPDEFGNADLRDLSRFNTKRSRAEQEEAEMTELMRQKRNMEIVNHDAGTEKNPATVITFASAKGGVGKTTLCVELATMLAMTKHGNSTYKVCIIDLNTDFGNVAVSLQLNMKKMCMTYWASDIEARIASGYDPDKITYTRAEIRSYLQQPPQNPKSMSDQPREGLENLYILCAPFNNIDSTMLKIEDVKIMMDNVINNGDFDYVLIDTGNNTRNTTFAADVRAKYVFMVVTQDINCAASNRFYHDLFAQLSNKHDIDMSKFKAVINMAHSKKAVGIGKKDVATFMRGMNKNFPIDTICVIDYNTDVALATNNGLPLVYTNSAHRFTKSIGHLASFLNSEEYVLEPPKKQGLFSRLFRKREE